MKGISLLLLSALVFSACSTAETTDTNTETTDTTEIVTQDVFTSDFEDVCNGVAQVKGTAYTEEAGIHPVLLFDRDSDTESYYEASFVLPEAWQVDWQEAGKYQLVTCVTTQPKEMAETCEFDIEGDVYTLNNYSADYAVSLYAATTGEELASTTFNLPAGECPSMYYFSSKNENYYPDYEQSLTEFLKPYVQK